MKKSLALIVAVGFVAVASEPPKGLSPVAKEGVKYIKMLGKGLKAEVKKRMKEDPTGLKAVEFCSENVKEVVQKITKDFPAGVKVRRTALKYRNPDNKPDEIDLKVMNQMVEDKKAKKFKAKPVVVDAGEKNRVYVPLLIDDVCLKCHGDASKIDPKVQEVIKKKYPGDKAVDFKLYDLRGVVVAELPKKSNEKEAK